MKILSGTLRGQKLVFRPNAHLRPTADKVRKAIFDRLRGLLAEKEVLDLFSGTGALGIEALSAGAKAATFVEWDEMQARRIAENLKRLKLLGRARVIAGEALETVQALSKKERRFDVIFADPPYESGWGQRVVEEVSRTGLLNEGGFLVLECRRGEALPSEEGFLKKVQSSLYGDTRVVIYCCPCCQHP